MSKNIKPVIILSLLVPSGTSYADFDDEDIIGAFKTTRGAHRAISALLKYADLADAFWDQSIIRKEAGINNLFLELEARYFNVIKSNKADELIVTFRNISKKSGNEVDAQDFADFDFSDDDVKDLKLNKSSISLEKTKRLYVKILICHTGKLFNIPDEL